MTQTEVFYSFKQHWMPIFSLVIGLITFGFLNVIFTKRIPIDSTKNLVLEDSKRMAVLSDTVTNGFWFPFIYSVLIAMIAYALLERPKYWYGIILVNIVLAMIFSFIQYQMIF